MASARATADSSQTFDESSGWGEVLAAAKAEKQRREYPTATEEATEAHATALTTAQGVVVSEVAMIHKT